MKQKPIWKKRKKTKQTKIIMIEMSKNKIQINVVKPFACNFYRWLGFSFYIVELWVIILFLFIVLYRLQFVPIHNSLLLLLLLWFLLLLLNTFGTSFRGLCNTVFFILFINELLSSIHLFVVQFLSSFFLSISLPLSASVSVSLVSKLRK